MDMIIIKIVKNSIRHAVELIKGPDNEFDNDAIDVCVEDEKVGMWQIMVIQNMN